MNKYLMRTISGALVDVNNPNPLDISLKDIAYNLAGIPRFLGSTSVPFSVAQHSVNISNEMGSSIAIHGLLHDAHEAYLGDLISPVKALFTEDMKIKWNRICNRMDRAIYTALGISDLYENKLKCINLIHYLDVHAMDVEMFNLKLALLPHHSIYTPIKQYEILGIHEAELQFISTFEKLTKKRV
jgi:hypothetical protein